MIIKAIVVTISLAVMGGAAVVPVEETDLQLTASDTDSGNWTANLGNMEVNIEHKHDSYDNANGTWTLGIARTSYNKNVEDNTSQGNEDEDEKEESVQNYYNKEIAPIRLPEEVSSLREVDDYHPESREHNEIPVEDVPIKSYAPDYPNIIPIYRRIPPRMYEMYPPPPPPQMGVVDPFFRIPAIELQPPAGNTRAEDIDSEEVVTDPDDFEHFKGVGWFKLDNRRLEWEDARKACGDIGAHLAVPDSLDRVQVFLQLFKRHPEIPTTAVLRDQVYIGVNDPEKNRTFTTVQGKPFNPGFPIWFLNEPNNENPGEYCVTFHMEGRTRDVPCFFEFPFICEKDVPMVF